MRRRQRMIKLLIVDDEKSIRELYKEEFSKEGYTIILAASGSEAVEKIKTESVDLVILDIRMPEIDGIIALEEMLKIRKKLPVIINTAYPQYKDNFLIWLAEDYVVKSTDLTELKKKVKSAIERKNLKKENTA